MTSASKQGKFENLENCIFTAINSLPPPYPSFVNTWLPHCLYICYSQENRVKENHLYLCMNHL